MEMQNEQSSLEQTVEKEKIGTLKVEPTIYPVKSMRGIPMPEAYISENGLQYDRMYAFKIVDGNPKFPWFTARKVPELVLFEPRFRTKGKDKKIVYDGYLPVIDIMTPEGDEIPNLRIKYFSEHLARRFSDQLKGEKLQLEFNSHGIYDVHQVSLIGLDTIAQLGEEAGIPMEHRRFRENFYVQFDSNEPFFEDSLVGKTLQIGGAARILVAEKDRRCVIVNIDPKNAAVTNEVKEAVDKNHGSYAGVYANVVKTGTVKVDYPVYLLKQ